ncbi:MAG: hypothetical protein ACI93T_002694 [Porticoccaceae bacterium]|jgi:hypothetical protein
MSPCCDRIINRPECTGLLRCQRAVNRTDGLVTVPGHRTPGTRRQVPPASLLVRVGELGERSAHGRPESPTSRRLVTTTRPNWSTRRQRHP